VTAPTRGLSDDEVERRLAQVRELPGRRRRRRERK
jgi:hypothetical protein